MKRRAIVKICVYSIIGFILASILIAFFAIDGITGCGGCSVTGFRYKNAKDYHLITENMPLDSENINRIEINWLGGEINISKSESLLSNEIVISESANKFDLSDNKDYVGRYLVTAGTLKIQYCKSMWFIKHNRTEKKINITLPTKYFNEIDIDTVSSRIEVNNVSFNELDLDSVSGDIKFNNTKINIINLDVVSAKVNSTLLSTNDLEIDTVSGDINLEFLKTPSNLKVDGVSADVTLILLDNVGFRAELDTVSGNINCEFETTGSKKQITYLDGRNRFSFDTVSGNISIKKPKNVAA